MTAAPTHTDPVPKSTPTGTPKTSAARYVALKKGAAKSSSPATSRRNMSEAAANTADRLKQVMEKGARAQWWHRRGTKEAGFWYEDVNGGRITDEAQLERIKRLVIPPSYADVRVSPSERNNLQVVAVDMAGRIQYRYHADWAACQARKKYAKTERFGQRLPLLRRVSNEHIAQSGLHKERVLAVVIRLINSLYFRLGSEDSVTRYHTFGITSLRNYHLKMLPGGELLFQFTGKHHIKQRRMFVDAELADVLAEIKALDGDHLFNYVDAQGQPRAVTPQDVNAYIKAAMGPGFSGKDFRTWGGTLQAAIALAEMGKTENPTQVKKNIVQAVKQVSEKLGNTPSVCRESYIHPIVFERYAQGVTLRDFRPRALRVIRHTHPEYDLEEAELLKLFTTAADCPA